MNIEVAERLHPFTSLPGFQFLLPKSAFRIKAFPAVVEIESLTHSKPKNIAAIRWDLSGPVKNFMMTQDLEKGEIRIQGEGAEGFFRYAIRSIENGAKIAVQAERTPTAGLLFRIEGNRSSLKNGLLQQKEEIVIDGEADESKLTGQGIERLSFGNHKKQDWDLIKRRGSFTEIFPLWYRLGQLIPQQKSSGITGTAALLEPCQRAIASGSPDTILEAFKALFLAGFEGGLSPRLRDSDHQGIKVGGEELHFDDRVEISPLILVSEGAKLIRSLFLQEDKGKVRLLPALPPEFSCGRLVNAACGVNGQVSIEWTKKILHKVVFASLTDQTISFDFCRGEARCRLRRSYHDHGTEYRSGESIKIVAGEQCWLDRFEK